MLKTFDPQACEPRAVVPLMGDPGRLAQRRGDPTFSTPLSARPTELMPESSAQVPSPPADALAHMQRLLADKHGELGQRAAAELGRWLSGAIPFAHPEVIARHLSPDRLPLLFDAFWQVLPFGTGGRRGRVGYGANRLNPSTVAMTIQGHCNFLRQRFAGRGQLAVVVANDVRVFRDVAGTYAFLGGD